MRAKGHASVEEHPKGSGKFRVRARVHGKLITVVSGVTEAEAQDCAAAFAKKRSQQDLRQGLTVGHHGDGFLERRELSGVRGISVDRNRWKRYVGKDPIANLPIKTLRRRDILDWLERMRKRKLAIQTIKNALNLLRVGLQDALDRELLQVNPARDVRLPRRLAATTKLDLDGVLTPDEQKSLLAVVPADVRHVVEFALYSGLRQAEHWWLHRVDAHADRVVVRFSKGGKPTKGGKPRIVHLLPEAAAALKVALEVEVRTPFAFPSPWGCRRQEGKAPRGWHRWVKAAGITRRVRWHDLRHTCATSLLAGWWGRKWSLEEVCALLGHSSVTVTERYARKVEELQSSAVAATVLARAESSQNVPQNIDPNGESSMKDAAPPARLERATFGLGKRRVSPKRFEVLSHATFPIGNNKTLSPQAWALVQAAERVLRGARA